MSGGREGEGEDGGRTPGFVGVEVEVGSVGDSVVWEVSRSRYESGFGDESPVKRDCLRDGEQEEGRERAGRDVGALHSSVW